MDYHEMLSHLQYEDVIEKQSREKERRTILLSKESQRKRIGEKTFIFHYVITSL